MAAIGLLDIPPEIHLQIVEFVGTRRALKALSATSRSIRSIAQSKLFERLRIHIGTKLGPSGSVDDLLSNPRICAAVRFLELLGGAMFSSHPHDDGDERLALIQKMLPKLDGLRKVSINLVNLSKAFLDTFLGIAANNPLQLSLGWNIFPYGVIPTPHTRLQISHLHLTVDYPSLEFCRSMFHASATTLTGLDLVADRDELTKLADINLPFLHDLTLLINVGYDISRTSAAAFLTAQQAIRKLHLRGEVRPLPPIPPNALPNLRKLKASTEQVSQLVPGRPVEEIEVISAQHGCDQDWIWEEVGQSTARVRMLRVHRKAAILETRMVKRMVTILPFLENLWSPVFDDVGWPFRSITRPPRLILLQTLLNAVEVLTSLKCLKILRFNLFRRTVWVYPNINDIATRLRNANPSFSCLEIRDGGGSGLGNAISVWNEVFGVFERM